MGWPCKPGPCKDKGDGGLRSTSLGWEVGYEKIAEACGGVGSEDRVRRERDDRLGERQHAGIWLAGVWSSEAAAQALKMAPERMWWSTQACKYTSIKYIVPLTSVL